MKKFELKRINQIILGPIEENRWESSAAFNPGVVQQNDIVHMLYRAVESENFSSVGYAKLDRYGKILYRHPEPVIKRTLDIERQGCEDVRVVSFNQRYFIFYTAFDGSNIRIALAETTDFINYKKYGQIGPDVTDKDAMIFPEKIKGKIVLLHRIEPNIQIASFDSFDHFIKPEKDYWSDYLRNITKYTVIYKEYDWETVKIGAGPPPILTDAGWLLIYHGVDSKFTYRVGAALLDYQNPLKVVAKLPYPILEPKREYEKIGDVNNVVFPQGMVLFDDELQVYYGGADRVVGLAGGRLSDLIEALWKYKIT